ncbi:hotdog domain-containing protein [Nocardioides humi]
MGSGPEDLFGVGRLRQCSDGVGGGMTLGRWATGPDRRTAVGAVGVLADEVLGYALMASLPQGAWSISTEIWLDVVGALPGAGDTVAAHATPVQAGSYAAGELRDGAGRPIVLCRQRGRFTTPPDGYDGPVVPAGIRSARGMEELLGLRAEGDVHVMETRPDLANPNGVLHGGVSLAASEVVATRTRVDLGCELPTSSVHIVHTRGVPVGAPVVFRCEARHAGRSLWVSEVVGTVAGKVCTVATVTAQE